MNLKSKRKTKVWKSRKFPHSKSEGILWLEYTPEDRTNDSVGKWGIPKGEMYHTIVDLIIKELSTTWNRKRRLIYSCGRCSSKIGWYNFSRTEEHNCKKETIEEGLTTKQRHDCLIREYYYPKYNSFVNTEIHDSKWNHTIERDVFSCTRYYSRMVYCDGNILIWAIDQMNYMERAIFYAQKAIDDIAKKREYDIEDIIETILEVARQCAPITKPSNPHGISLLEVDDKIFIRDIKLYNALTELAKIINETYYLNPGKVFIRRKED